MKRLAKTLVVTALIAVPVLAHLAVVTSRGVAVAGVLVAMQAGLVGWVTLSLAARRWPAVARGVLAGLVFGFTLLICEMEPEGLAAAAAVPHAISFVGLLAFFAASLAPGETPVITLVAMRARGALSPKLMAYTRRVTIAWCCFFAAELATSLLLWALAPLAWWSGFVNLAGLPAVLLMFAAELAWRHVHHGIHPVGGGRWLRARGLLDQIRAARSAGPVQQAEP